MIERSVLQVDTDGSQKVVIKQLPDDWDMVQTPFVEQQITTLKTQLTETDYKIIKCSEYSLSGLDAPYNIAALHAERQAIRDQINGLANGEQAGVT